LEAALKLRRPEGPFSQLGVFPKLPETPGSLGGEIPALGQHAASALEFAGLSKKDIDALIQADVAPVSK